MAWMGTCGRGGAWGIVWGHVTGCEGMMQGVGSCGRGWRHVTRARCIWQGQGWGHVAGKGAFGRVVACGRVWGHMPGCGVMW